ncbi:MAG: HD domain-containing phosphohydrolase, partial [Anaerovoracaceae bacterium]
MDDDIQKELLTRLIYDYSRVTKELETTAKRLERNREALEEAQKIAKLGRWDLDWKTKELTWSDSMYQVLEMDLSMTPDQTLFFTRVHPDDVIAVESRYDQFSLFKESWEAEYRLRMDDGRVKWVHLHYHPVFDSNNQLARYYGTIQDITLIKETELELEKYTQHLEDLVEEKVKEITDSQLATIFGLIKLSESRDDETGNHIERTSGFCRLLAEKTREKGFYLDLIEDSFIETIEKASPLHDIGKVGIPDHILLKPGKLTEEEFVIMKSHVEIGYQTLEKMEKQYPNNALVKMGMEIALNHHERWDGSGYPKGKAGESIPLAARIMSLADVYDALRSKR